MLVYAQSTPSLRPVYAQAGNAGRHPRSMPNVQGQDATRRDQMQSDAIRRSQTQSDAIRHNQIAKKKRNQTQSVIAMLIVHGWQATTPKVWITDPGDMWEHSTSRGVFFVELMHATTCKQKWAWTGLS